VAQGRAGQPRPRRRPAARGPSPVCGLTWICTGCRCPRCEWTDVPPTEQIRMHPYLRRRPPFAGPVDLAQALRRGVRRELWVSRGCARRPWCSRLGQDHVARIRSVSRRIRPRGLMGWTGDKRAHSAPSWQPRRSRGRGPPFLPSLSAREAGLQGQLSRGSEVGCHSRRPIWTSTMKVGAAVSRPAPVARLTPGRHGRREAQSARQQP
jgi:hypothetical protein